MNISQCALSQKEKALIRELLENPSTETIFTYCLETLETLSQTLTPSPSSPCPTSLPQRIHPSQISKHLFQEELRQIEEKMRGGAWGVEVFVLILMGILKGFEFDQWGGVVVGLRDMFREVGDGGVGFKQFFQYAIGEVLDFNTVDKNTKFQVHFEELPKQDHIIHDNGIKKVNYCNNLKIYLVLDEESPCIKIYSKEMRLMSKFIPSTEKHFHKYPLIVDFHWNFMQKKLGLILSDSTFSLVNLEAFLNKSKFDFENDPSNEIVIQFTQRFTMAIYVNMLDKWVLVSGNNKIYICHFDKMIGSTPEMQEITTVHLEHSLSHFMELIPISTICLCSKNEMYLIDEKLAKIKGIYTHHTDILWVNFCENEGSFYVCGKEREITEVKLEKNGNFSVKTHPLKIKHDLCGFGYFWDYRVAVIVDENCELRIYDFSKRICYPSVSYSGIAKSGSQKLRLQNIYKNEFCLYSGYMLMFELNKIAIEQEKEFYLHEKIYYDHKKQEFWFCANYQILSFSLLQGEIRKSYSEESSNISRFFSFYKDSKTNLLVLDEFQLIYEVYQKEELKNNEYKTYKKKVPILEAFDFGYDPSHNLCIVVGRKGLQTVRNDGNNIFTLVSSLEFENVCEFTNFFYNSDDKMITLCTEEWQFIEISMKGYQILANYTYTFPKDKEKYRENLILVCKFCEEINAQIILTTLGEIYIIVADKESKPKPSEKSDQDASGQAHSITSQMEENKEEKKEKEYMFKISADGHSQTKITAYILKIEEYLPKRTQEIEWKNLSIDSTISENSLFIMLSDEIGNFIELNLSKTFEKHFTKQKKNMPINHKVKDNHKINISKYKINNISIENSEKVVLGKEEVVFIKANEKCIKIMGKVWIEGVKTLTISIDGHIKLWQGKNLLFQLRLPDFKKVKWDMEAIESSLERKSMEETLAVLKRIHAINNERQSPQNVLHKKSQKEIEESKEIRRLNLEEPIPLEIENKKIEDIVCRTSSINWNIYSNSSKTRRNLQRNSLISDRKCSHPWRTRSEFQKLLSKASPENKYNEKMPSDLIQLRKGLDMRAESPAGREGELKILPLLKTYHMEQKKEKELGQTIDHGNMVSFSEPASFRDEEPLEPLDLVDSSRVIRKTGVKKRVNEFDEIDREFNRKWLILSSRKIVIKDSKEKSLNLSSPSKNQRSRTKSKEQCLTHRNTSKKDPIKEIKTLFELHNRECSLSKKGRIIKIPELPLKKEHLFFS